MALPMSSAIWGTIPFPNARSRLTRLATPWATRGTSGSSSQIPNVSSRSCGQAPKDSLDRMSYVFCCDLAKTVGRRFCTASSASSDDGRPVGPLPHGTSGKEFGLRLASNSLDDGAVGDASNRSPRKPCLPTKPLSARLSSALIRVSSNPPSSILGADP